MRHFIQIGEAGCSGDVPSEGEIERLARLFEGGVGYERAESDDALLRVRHFNADQRFAGDGSFDSYWVGGKRQFEIRLEAQNF